MIIVIFLQWPPVRARLAQPVGRHGCSRWRAPPPTPTRAGLTLRYRRWAPLRHRPLLRHRATLGHSLRHRRHQRPTHRYRCGRSPRYRRGRAPPSRYCVNSGAPHRYAPPTLEYQREGPPLGYRRGGPRRGLGGGRTRCEARHELVVGLGRGRCEWEGWRRCEWRWKGVRAVVCGGGRRPISMRS